jgi:hypothetical protein
MKSVSFAFPLLYIFLSLFPQAALPQDFSSIDRDLTELENLIQDTLANSEAQLKQQVDFSH